MLESTSAEELTTFNVCKGVINCTGILIDLFKVESSTGVHITREGELCVKVRGHVSLLSVAEAEFLLCTFPSLFQG